jgi:hypothetical protein
MGVNQPDFKSAVIHICQQLDPSFNLNQIEERNLSEICDDLEVNEIFDFLNNKIYAKCEFKNALKYFNLYID